ncbi:hypothetical protein CI109_106333 [Kwoniella shandongensis]|uniref:Zn(2)-C6 fungal-type domain-containing protein n=1 Tax=Kwoniella shandongensis TaxID=1734106 RepID=A0AAJ8MY80_9TREE
MPEVPKPRPLARGDACQGCKTRKVRCPAEKPSCSRCAKRNRTCIYLTSPTSFSDSGTSSRQHSPQKTFTSHQCTSDGTKNSRPGYTSFVSRDSISSIELVPSRLPSPVKRASLPIFDATWTGQYHNVVGIVPSLAGNDQPVPSHWEKVDMSSLLGQTKVLGIDDGELTEAERDHLLLLYFTNQRIFGLDMHIATFYNKLQSRDPAVRPHPCLLNAMYLVSCQASPVESLRRRESLFLKRAKEGMDQAIGKDQRMFDAMRAGTVLCAWLHGAERHPEGWAMMGQTRNIAVACGLHRIHSSDEIDVRPSARELRRGPGLHLPASETYVELADRIYAFWALFMLDRCAAISFDWPAGFDVNHITTPLPRPWSEYESADPHLGTCDERLASICDAEPPTQTCEIEHRTDLGHIVKALELMLRASQRPPPNEQLLIAEALRRFIGSLPEAMKQTVQSMDGKRIVEAGTAALMLLYSIDADTRPDPRALEVTRRILGVLHLLQDANVGDVNVFVIIIWTRTAQLMIWESKRLEAEGDIIAAASYVRDVHIVTDFMSRLGHISLAGEALKEIENWWKTDEVEFQRENDNARKKQSSAK